MRWGRGPTKRSLLPRLLPWSSKCNLWTSSVSNQWGNLFHVQISSLIPELLTQKLWVWAQEYILTSLLGDSDTSLNLRTTEPLYTLWTIFKCSSSFVPISVKRYEGRDHIKDWFMFYFTQNIWRIGLFPFLSYHEGYWVRKSSDLDPRELTKGLGEILGWLLV